MRLTMIGWSFLLSPAMSVFPLHVALELDEGRPLGGVQHLAAELHCHLRRVALHRREQRGLDALQLLAALVELLLEQARQRLEDAVGQEDAEEGADQRRADHLAEHRRRL